MDSFLNGANYYYLMVYPSVFSGQYMAWWDQRNAGERVSEDFTCLILRIAACAAMFVMPDVRRDLEAALKIPMSDLSQRFHHTANDLAATLPTGKGGLVRIQGWHLAAFWHKSENEAMMAWYCLTYAIREAQMQGRHCPESAIRRVSDRIHFHRPPPRHGPAWGDRGD
jgi:hypothetical protein